MELAFVVMGRGEAEASTERAERLAAERSTERPTSNERLMEEVVERENLKKALRRVKSNKGSEGIDKMTVEQLPAYLAEHWSRIRQELLTGRYRPAPVLGVEIPKPDGGVRKLGIPTVLDRFIQQAILQVMQTIYDPTFSEHSYGFRPKRSAHQAVAEAQKSIAEGYRWVVDLDLEKFFDRVGHDRLMSRLARTIADKRVLKVIRAYLNAGVMEDGLVSPTTEGTPQGGPLSPLLSNVVLDELDRELERRGHRFVRYADDCNIYVQSRRAGERVMKSIAHFITHKLKLKVNDSKSAVDRVQRRKLLGFTFLINKGVRRAIAKRSLQRMKTRIRELTGRIRRKAVEQIVEEVAEYLRGWRGYFGFCETPSVLRKLDSWIRRRLRSLIWAQWQRPQAQHAALIKRGVSPLVARHMASSGLGPWHLGLSAALNVALPDAYFTSLGLPQLAP